MEGRVFSYIHFNGQVGSLVKISTITDFAARTDEFLQFGKEVAMQIAMTAPKTIDELLKQTFIKDEFVAVQDLVNNVSKTLGEKVGIVGFERFDFKHE